MKPCRYGQSKEEGKDTESKKLSITYDPVHRIGK